MNSKPTNQPPEYLPKHLNDLCAVCGGRRGLHNNMNQRCPKDINSSGDHTEYRDTVFSATPPATVIQPLGIDVESVCQKCNGRNPTWYADNELFNKVNGSPNGIICPACFEKKADEMGINILFKAVYTTPQSSTSEEEKELWGETISFFLEACAANVGDKIYEKVVDELQSKFKISKR